MLSKMTLAALHNYNEATLWEKLSLPAGIDADIFKAECLRQASEFPLLYPNLEFMSYQIGVWSAKWYHNFSRWYDVYTEEYNALYNVDVSDIHSESATNNESQFSSKSGNLTTSSNGQSAGTSTDTGTNLKSKAAYDAATLQPIEQDSNTASASNSLSTSEYNSQSNYDSESMSMTSDHNIYYTDTKFGNQGVTMAQEMLLAEYNAWYFNLYEHMAEIFVNEFCICIYQ